MEKMTYREYKNALKMIGISYLGNYSQSAKMVLNQTVGHELTYSLYLAPWKLAGVVNGKEINACPAGEHCKDFCLVNSGRAKIEQLTNGIGVSNILRSRIKKTRLFYTNRRLFMAMLCYELEHTRAYAYKKGCTFSVRLNCTSDLSPLAFSIDGVNILEMYPDVQFYDYTKVPSRLVLAAKYQNYDVTFSYDGYNWDTCEQALNMGVNIAVVFESKVVPSLYKGYPVINMTKSDLRYKDAKNQNQGFVGYLEYHRTANDYKNGKYIRPNTPFVIKEDDKNIIYAFKEKDEPINII